MIILQLCEFYLVTNREVWQLEDSFVGIFYVLKLSNKIVIYSLYLGCPMHQSEKKNLLKSVENWANDVYVRLFIAVQFWALRYINNRCCHNFSNIYLFLFFQVSPILRCVLEARHILIVVYRRSLLNATMVSKKILRQSNIALIKD